MLEEKMSIALGKRKQFRRLTFNVTRLAKDMRDIVHSSNMHMVVNQTSSIEMVLSFFFCLTIKIEYNDMVDNKTGYTMVRSFAMY